MPVLSPRNNLSSAQCERQNTLLLPDNLSVRSEDIDLALLDQTLSGSEDQAVTDPPPMSPSTKVKRFEFNSFLRMSTPTPSHVESLSSPRVGSTSRVGSDSTLTHVGSLSRLKLPLLVGSISSEQVINFIVWVNF